MRKKDPKGNKHLNQGISEPDPLFKSNAPAPMSMLKALDKIQEKAFSSKLSEEFWSDVEKEILYITTTLNLTPIQSVVLAILCEQGDSLCWKSLGRYLGISRMKAMTYDHEITGLVKRRWIYRCGSRDRGVFYQGFKLMPGVVTAIRENRIFTPEPLDGFNTQEYIERMVIYMNQEGQCSDIRNEDHLEWLLELAELNKDLPLARALLELNSRQDAMVMILAVVSYAEYDETNSEPLSLNEIAQWFESGWSLTMLQRRLQKGETEPQQLGWLQFCNGNGMIDTSRFVLSSKAKEGLLADFTPDVKERKLSLRNVISHESIAERPLYFNSDTERQVERLEKLLEEESLQKIRAKLDQRGMRRGITALFYGAPGTGKTESALQLARMSGRNIMQVNIAGMRDKFVGESEKNIKALFNRYRDLSKQSDRLPILLFNEADAIIGTRFETTTSSVEKMDNAMQNIILQEMENFDGILIATTNLTGNLDRAFDRRFLFKMEFTRPDRETRGRIWRSMLFDVEETAVKELSWKFDFSGGQIENIARKYNIESLLDNANTPKVDLLRRLCAEETLKRSNRENVGFIRG